MRLYINKNFLKNDDTLPNLFSALQSKSYLDIDMQSDSEYLIITEINSLYQQSKIDCQKQIYRFLKSRLLDDFFNNYLQLSDDEPFMNLKDSYSNFIFETKISRKFQSSLVVKFIDQHKENMGSNKNENLIKEFSSYLDEKFSNSMTFKAEEGNQLGPEFKSNIFDKMRDIKLKITKKKADLDFKYIQINLIKEKIIQKVDKIVNDLQQVANYKLTHSIKYDNIQLLYQDKIANNLKLYREFLDIKIKNELYGKDQILALRIIRDHIEKRINYLKANKSYAQERSQVFRSKRDDPEFMKIVHEILEVNGKINKVENDIQSLKEQTSLNN